MSSPTSKPQVRVGVGALVVHERKALLLLRQGAHGTNSWGFPGGHQEFGETPEQTAVRETFEESGLSVQPIKRIGFTNDEFPDKNKHYVTLFLHCVVISGTACIMEPDKASELEWFALGELQARKRELFVPVQHLLTEYPDAMAELLAP